MLNLPPRSDLICKQHSKQIVIAWFVIPSDGKSSTEIVVLISSYRTMNLLWDARRKCLNLRSYAGLLEDVEQAVNVNISELPWSVSCAFKFFPASWARHGSIMLNVSFSLWNKHSIYPSAINTCTKVSCSVITIPRKCWTNRVYIMLTSLPEKSMEVSTLGCWIVMLTNTHSVKTQWKVQTKQLWQRMHSWCSAGPPSETYGDFFISLKEIVHSLKPLNFLRSVHWLSNFNKKSIQTKEYFNINCKDFTSSNGKVVSYSCFIFVCVVLV